MAIFNDMLRSPTLSAGACSKSASSQNLHAPRPRSASAPWLPDQPAELPGSLLQQNQGYPYFETPDFSLSRPTSQNIRRGTHPPDIYSEDEGDVLDLLHLFPEPLNHSKSVPSLHAEYRDGAMKSSRVGPAVSVSANNTSKSSRMHRRRGLSEMNWHIDTDLSAVKNPIPAIASPYRNTSNEWAQPRTEHGDLSQPPSVAFEAGSQRRSRERRASRRDDVSTECFSPAMVHSPSSCYA